MKKYLVLRTNHGFQGRMWRKDEVVEFDNDVIVEPKNFQILDGGEGAKKAEETIVDEKTALSQLQRKQVKPLPTAGQVLKNQKRAGQKVPEEQKVSSKEDF